MAVSEPRSQRPAIPQPRPDQFDAAGAKVDIESVATDKVSWLNIERPTTRETEYLARHYPFNSFDLEDCLSRVERPKLDRYEDYLFLVLHFPVYDREARATIPSQVAIFAGSDYVVTLHSGDLKPLTQLFRECQESELAREENMGRSAGYLLYRILDRLVDYLFPILNRIINNVEQVEDKVFSQDPRGTVQELAILRRGIISLRRIVRPQISVIDSLERWQLLFPKEEELGTYFGDIGDHIRKIWDELEDYHQVVEVLNDTNNSLTSYRTNQVMRVFTVIATIMLPLTLVASLYGMNVSWLPLATSHWSFVIILGLLGLITGGMLFFFRRRRWL